MYGCIFLNSIQANQFNKEFLHTKNIFFMSISLWQYWWWFWFITILSLYYILVIKHLLYKNYKFDMKLFTNKKSHGKWGDLIVAAGPVLWCSNILANSNFLLRLNEW